MNRENCTQSAFLGLQDRWGPAGNRLARLQAENFTPSELTGSMGDTAGRINNLGAIWGAFHSACSVVRRSTGSDQRVNILSD